MTFVNGIANLIMIRAAHARCLDTTLMPMLKFNQVLPKYLNIDYKFGRPIPYVVPLFDPIVNLPWLFQSSLFENHKVAFSCTIKEMVSKHHLSFILPVCRPMNSLKWIFSYIKMQ